MITLCMGIYNSVGTLPEVLKSIKGQMFDKFILFDNESTDKGVELVKESFPDVQVISFKHERRVLDNWCNLRLEMFKASDTDLTFCLDSDVVLPEGAIEELSKWVSDKVPVVGIPYSRPGHVQFGATIVKTSVGKQLKYDKRMGCDCLTCFNEISSMGLMIVNHPTMRAKHLRHQVINSRISPSKVYRSQRI